MQPEIRKFALLFFLVSSVSILYAQDTTDIRDSIPYCIDGVTYDSAVNSVISKVKIQAELEAIEGNKPENIFTFSDGSGYFKLCSKSTIKSITLTTIGYEDKIISMTNSSESRTKLDKIYLSTSVATLQGVSAKTKKETEPLTIDKKTYSVSQNILATGGTAIDALKQIPAVNVDNDGNISLRGGNNITIYINGKQSSLTGADRQALLMQIPAANIESIEVNTNPGAKLDAEGQSGIINITLKHNVSKYKNGYITLGIGTHNKYNGIAAFNTNYKKFSFSNTFSFRQNDLWGYGYNRRDNHSNLVTNSIDQYNDNDNLTYNYTLSGNIDYNANKTILLSVNYLLSNNTNTSEDFNRIELVDWKDSLYQVFSSDIFQKSVTKNIDAGLTVRKTFDKPSNNLIFMFNYSTTGVNSDADFIRNELNTLNNEILNQYPSLLYNTNINHFSMPLLQLDYTKSLFKDFKLETGLKYTGRDLDNNFIVDSFNNQSQINEMDYGKSNHFLYSENVSAAYGMVTHSLNKLIKYNLGIRFENTSISGNQLSTNEKFKYDYQNLFPSGNINFALQKRNNLPDIQLSYSKRINRPGQGELNPFVNFNDPFNLSKGNPLLRPEISHAFELSSLYNTKAIVYTVTLYGRQTNSPISRYSVIDSNGISTVSRVNLDYNRSIGGEVIVRFTPLKDMKVTLNGNLYRYFVVGNVLGNSFVNERLSYTGKAIVNYLFWKKTDFQASFNYMGPIITPQGSLKPMYGLEIGFKKDIIKDKLSINLNLADVFNNRRFAITIDDPSFNSSIYRKRETRILTFNITWKFGSTDSKISDKKPKQQERPAEMDF